MAAVDADNGDDAFIQFVDPHHEVKFSNKTLRELIQVSTSSIPQPTNDLQSNEPFMKSLDEYADKKSKEIIKAMRSSLMKTKISVGSPAPHCSKNFETTLKIIDTLVHKPTSTINDADNHNEKVQIEDRYCSEGQPAVASQFVTKTETDSAYYSEPVDSESSEYEKIIKKHYKSCTKNTLEAGHLLKNSPYVIARKILEETMGTNFSFQIRVYNGSTGISRLLQYNYNGEDTFEEVSYLFKHKFCFSENFLWFYLNHKGKLMEVHDTLTLKQMLVTHGAYPKGIANVHKEVAKVLCITRCSSTEETVFDHEMDLIMGLENQTTSQSCGLDDKIMFEIAPDVRYTDVFKKTIYYSVEEEQRVYNNYESVRELILHCRRHISILRVSSETPY